MNTTTIDIFTLLLPLVVLMLAWSVKDGRAAFRRRER